MVRTDLFRLHNPPVVDCVQRTTTPYSGLD